MEMKLKILYVARDITCRKRSNSSCKQQKEQRNSHETRVEFRMTIRSNLFRKSSTRARCVTRANISKGSCCRTQRSPTARSVAKMKEHFTTSMSESSEESSHIFERCFSARSLGPETLTHGPRVPGVRPTGRRSFVAHAERHFLRANVICATPCSSSFFGEKRRKPKRWPILKLQIGRRGNPLQSLMTSLQASTVEEALRREEQRNLILSPQFKLQDFGSHSVER